MRIREVVLRVLYVVPDPEFEHFANKIPQIKITIELLMIALPRRNIELKPKE